MRWRWAIQASRATRRRSATPWAMSSAAAGAKASASFGEQARGSGRRRPSASRLRLPAAREPWARPAAEQAAGRVHAQARGAPQHGLAVGVQRVVAPERARPDAPGARIGGDLGRRGGDLVVGVVHAVRRMPGGSAPLAPGAAEALVAGAVRPPRQLVRAGLELHRPEHAARVRDECAGVAPVPRLDRPDRCQQLPRHAVGAAPALVQHEVVARNARDGGRARHAGAAGAPARSPGRRRRRPAQWRLAWRDRARTPPCFGTRQAQLESQCHPFE